MQHVKGPDFPTRGIIMGRAGIRAAYATGRGRIHVRARTEIEEFGQNRQRIVVTELSEYIRGDGNEPQKRGGRGMKNYQVTEKTGKVAAVKVVNDSDDVLLVADNGIVIRMAAADINTYGRATQGVRLMTLMDGAKVISIARTEHEESPAEGENVDNSPAGDGDNAE